MGATITQPASIGTIDLAFYLDITGSAIQTATSYIDLDKTLLFTAVAPKIAGKDHDGIGDACDSTPDFCWDCLPRRSGWRSLLH
jgi:hypothetical protein